jgi:hypothetical protein
MGINYSVRPAGKLQTGLVFQISEFADLSKSEERPVEGGIVINEPVFEFIEPLLRSIRPFDTYSFETIEAAHWLALAAAVRKLAARLLETDGRAIDEIPYQGVDAKLIQANFREGIGLGQLLLALDAICEWIEPRARRGLPLTFYGL